MPNNRGTFQGNLAGTGSRILEMLTSSKAVTASYAVTASRLATSNVGQNGQPVYFQDGVPVADTKTQDIVNWVVANSGSISGATGSSADTNIQVQELVEKSGSWENASSWVGENSSSVSNTITKVNNLKGISFATGSTRITASYHPTSSSQVVINIPSNPGHIGAASASHNHTFDQITDGTAISASVKRLEVSASTIKNSYVTTASFNSFTQSVASGFLPITGGTLTGNLETKDVFISGNLTVGGTTTTIDAQNLNVKDKLILIASGSTTQAAANGAGIAVSTASAGEGGAARIQYLSSGNKFTSSVAFEAPSFTGSLKGTATNAVSASYSTQAGVSISASYATSASHAKNSDKATSASYASASTTASYALVAESVKDASGLTVKSADTASYVEWNNVNGHPTFVSATFQTGAFSATKTYNPVGSAQTINIPSTTTHISGLNTITASVKQMVAKTGSWDGVASTASAAYQSASKALATASVAQREAESASFYKTQASASAADADYFASEAEDRMIDAGNYAEEASGSMEDARIYRANAATNATLTSTYAVQASASAVLAAASASRAATYATRAQQSASNAHTFKTLAAASASAASSSAATAANWAVSASASATRISASTAEAAQYASNASASASLMYKNVGSATQPVFMSASVGPVAATPYESASVKEAVTASYANSVSVAAVNTNASLPILIAAAATPANPGPVKYDTNLTYNASTNRMNVTHVSATGLTGSLRGNVTGTASYATSASRAISAASADSATSATSASYAANSTTASYALIAEAVKDGAGLVVNTASYALLAEEAKTALTASYNAEAAALRTIITNNSASWAQDNDTKVTSAANHYKATNQISGSQGGTNTTYVHAITLDAAGHVTAVSTTNTSSIKAASASYATNADSAKASTSASYSNYAGNAGQLAGQAASNYALKSYTDGAYLPITGGVVTGDLTVQKNFTVAGTTSYLNTTDLIVKDKLILVSSGSTTQANSDGAGIAIQTASATTVANAEKAAARFQYRSSDNHFTASVGIVAPSFTGSLLGTASRAVSASRADSAASATSLVNASATANVNRPIALWSSSTAGAQPVYSNSSFYYNPGTSTLTATKVSSTEVTASTGFRGNLVGNVTGNLTGTASFATSASRAVSAASADSATTATTASYNKAGADALAWITANSASATTNTDRYVNTASFASTGSNGANGVKMTLTRAGSDTTQVTATIPVASATAAGVVTGAQFKSWTSGSNWVGANSASVATAIANSHTHSNKAVLDGITAAKTASWDGVASTASQAYQDAVKALATASVAQVQAESASNYKSQASASAAAAATSATRAQTYRNSASSSASKASGWSISASTYAKEASGSMEDARFYSAQAATNATLASTYAIQASASANIISASTVDAQRYATNASASASLLYTNVGTEMQPVYMTTAGPRSSSLHMVESIVDTRTAAGAAFTGVSKDSELYDGKVIVFRSKFAGASNVTLNLTLAGGTTTGAKPVYLAGTTRLGTHYAANTAILMVYDATLGGWRVHADYNTDTTYPRNVSNVQFNGNTVANDIVVYNAGATGSGAQVVKDSGVSINDLVASASIAASAAGSSHTHSNKAVLDGITAADTASWDGKWTYNEATIKAVKVNLASRADSAASATTATKLAGTSGSTSIPVYINAGVPTVCSGTVVSTADRNTWTTASNRANAANDGLTTPLYGSQREQENGVPRGAFKIVDASGGNVAIDIQDDEVPSQGVDNYGAGVGTKLSIWGGLILNVAGTVEFYSEANASFVWSENSVDIETGGTYEFNCIQYEMGGTIYGIITKYSES